MRRKRTIQRKEHESSTLSIRIPNEMRKQLERFAKKKSLPITLFARMVLKERINKLIEDEGTKEVFS